MKIGIILFLLTSFINGYAQKHNDEVLVKQTINQLFDGMRNSDTTLIRQAFAQKQTMATIVKINGKAEVRIGSLNEFIKGIGTPHTEKYDERIVFTKVLIDDNLASVWTDYKFYIGNNFSHCGVNSFQLVKGETGWKIVYLIDTRRKDKCN